jgi:SAM-dependent methyltransferase
MPARTPSDARMIEEVFWIVLGRAPSPVDLRDEMRSGERHTLLMRLLSSPEFHTIRRTGRAGSGPEGDGEARELGLRALGPDDRFVQRAYEYLLGRPADESGFRHYAAALAAGETRTNLIRSLAASEEFDRRFRDLAPESAVVPHDTQLCELANPAKWDNPEWLDILRSLGLSADKLSMHRKPYELTQLIFGCRRLGALREDSQILSVGAGHELVLFWLANHVDRVVATDMYEGVWQDVQGREGDPDVIRQPEDYAPFPYRRDHLTFMKMDGRRLAFRDGTFDVVYSLSSIEHFGGIAGATDTLREMARVLKPGGVLALATEYVLQGPPHDETFQPHEFARLVDQPGLRLVEPLDDRVYHRYEYAAIDLYKNPYQAPHMVVRFNETVFTTAMVFLRRV